MASGDSFSPASVARPREGGHSQAALQRLRARAPLRDEIQVRMDRPTPGLRLEAITPPRPEIMRIWRTFRPVDRAFIQDIIKDVVMLTETPVDWIFLRTAAEFWDPQHAVFNFQGTELAPTIEEYTCDACHGFLLLIFGTLLFPYAPNLIDGAIAQVVLQAVGGHSYVEVLLAETVRSLNYVREVIRQLGRSERFTVNRTLAPYSVFNSPSIPPTKSEHFLPHQHTWLSFIHRDRRRRSSLRPPRSPEQHLHPSLKPKTPPKQPCAQSYSPSGRSEIDSVASLLTLVQRSRTTGSFRRS
ncbi:hypothetical protein CRG98_025777 [Punica granatum]|uniref:Aminotransferase-like plant mobile domain-containing protein n=1 Tax=Punica granatum TaxID=22663 RepID=A0A2I0JDU5_PUNGR|nr:hypothetical protein CRG98_025777 [Punica granatum]